VGAIEEVAVACARKEREEGRYGCAPSILPGGSEWEKPCVSRVCERKKKKKGGGGGTFQLMGDL